jgi:hypothetical protein
MSRAAQAQGASGGGEDFFDHGETPWKQTNKTTKERKRVD